MSGPTAILAAQGAGSLFSAMGARDAAKAQKSALQAEAILADTNAKILEMNAQADLIAGQREEQKSRLNTAQLKGSQKVALAAAPPLFGGRPDQSSACLSPPQKKRAQDARTRLLLIRCP